MSEVRELDGSGRDHDDVRRLLRGDGGDLKGGVALPDDQHALVAIGGRLRPPDKKRKTVGRE